jgi:pimeloyl-ACP methyl ester carboxylesterase
MSTTNTNSKANTTGLVTAAGVELYVDQRGSGPDVLLIAGLSDPAEAWTFQLDGLADQYRMTAFDNRGAGRSPMPPEG